MRVNGSMVVDEWRDQHSRFEASFDIDQSGWHNIDIQLYQAQGGQRLQIQWSAPETNKWRTFGFEQFRHYAQVQPFQPNLLRRCSIPSREIHVIKQALIEACHEYGSMMTLHAQCGHTIMPTSILMRAVKRMTETRDTLQVSGQSASDHDWTLAGLMSLPQLFAAAEKNHASATNRCRDIWRKRFAAQIKQDGSPSELTFVRQDVNRLNQAARSLERWSKNDSMADRQARVNQYRETAIAAAQSWRNQLNRQAQEMKMAARDTSLSRQTRQRALRLAEELDAMVDQQIEPMMRDISSASDQMMARPQSFNQREMSKRLNSNSVDDGSIGPA